MKKVFRMEGLDCAACAAKLERKLAALPGVDTASVNFLAGKLSLEAEESRMESVLEQVMQVIRKLEPGLVLRKA